MLSIGNDDLKERPLLGDFILCDKCGRRHKVETFLSEKGTISIQTYMCSGKRYMVGLEGKDIRSSFFKR